MAYIGNQPSQVAFVTDSFSGNGSTTAFTMSVAPANTASVLVAVSGVLQDPSTYSVSGLTLTFSAAPPTGTSNISARYLGIPASGVTTTAYRTITEFTATANQKTFTPPSYTAGFINVYRNGVLLGSADYTATNGTTIVLASGATAGDLVTVESFYVSSVLNAIPATAGSVGQTYLANNSVGASQLQSSGSGAIAGCRAWIWLYDNGSSVAIQNSFNVTSVTRNATCDWTINFTNAMPSSSYAVVGSAGLNTTSMRNIALPWNSTSPTTTAVRVQAVTADGTLASNAQACISVFA